MKNGVTHKNPADTELATLWLDSDMLTWFRRQGRGYQTRINAILRAYYEAHQRNAKQ